MVLESKMLGKQFILHFHAIMTEGDFLPQMLKVSLDELFVDMLF
jgi:hypothetical protein